MPLSQCIRKGDLRAFDEALQRGEDEFVKRRIYLTLERGRDIALRNLLRKVFIAGGFDEPKEGDTTHVRRSRVPVAEFRTAICMGSGGDLLDTDEVECLLANMIYKVSSNTGVTTTSKPTCERHKLLWQKWWTVCTVWGHLIQLEMRQPFCRTAFTKCASGCEALSRPLSLPSPYFRPLVTPMRQSFFLSPSH